MLYYQIKNYEDFKKRFGLTTREKSWRQYSYEPYAYLHVQP